MKKLIISHVLLWLFTSVCFCQKDEIVNDGLVHSFINYYKFSKDSNGLAYPYANKLIVNKDTIHYDYDFTKNDTVTDVGLINYNESVKKGELTLIGYGVVVRRSFPLSCICFYYTVVNFEPVNKIIRKIEFKNHKIVNIITD